VARAATAVPGTMDGGGVLYDSTDPATIAATIHHVVSDRTVEEDVLRRQDEALDRLVRRDFAGLLLGFVNQALATPRLAPPAVAPDFWRQFRDAEALDALRETRPAAFRALPPAPEAARVADLGHRR
jgi:hypothetical protein